jgi:hypothetical protein
MAMAASVGKARGTQHATRNPLHQAEKKAMELRTRGGLPLSPPELAVDHGWGGPVQAAARWRHLRLMLGRSSRSEMLGGCVFLSISLHAGAFGDTICWCYSLSSLDSQRVTPLHKTRRVLLFFSDFNQTCLHKLQDWRGEPFNHQKEG